MLLRQILHDDLGCASYLVGDEAAGVAAVVDPRLDVDVYLDLADYLGVRIERVFETHTHADHVSGHGRLVAATGATLHIHREALPSFEHEPFDDGEEWLLGQLRIEALHTPGHRPEHTAFLLAQAADRDPWAVLSGDSLFVNEVARPDLAIEPTEGARQLFHSLHERLLTLPATVEVWPGHLGGSMCGGPEMDMRPVSTIGFECHHNELLGIREEVPFVERALARLGPPPPNSGAIVKVNRAPLSSSRPELSSLSPQQVEALADAGAMVVDVRPGTDFAAAHVPGAVTVPANRAGFGSRLASVADPGREIVLVGAGDADSRRAAELAAAVAVTWVVGLLEGGIGSWAAAGLASAALEQVGVGELDELIERVPDLQILDVRDPEDWVAAHLPGSLNLPLSELRAFPTELDPELPVATICRSGQKAAVAASLLTGLGAKRVIHVRDGGVPAWVELHRDCPAG